MRGKKTYSCLLWGMISLIILSINVFHVKGFEHIEGNTTVRNAFEIPYLPFKLSVNIEDRNDVRWFKVELSQPGALRAITELYSGLVYDIYAEEELQKENPRPVVTNNVSITYDYCNYWKLEAGTYYIKLYPINSTDWKDKEINIEWDLFEDDEYEPNDTYQQATLVQLGEPMPVRITGYNDIEWFKIKVDKSKGLKIKSDGYFGLGYYIYSEDELQKESPTPLKVCRYYNYNSDYNCSLNSSNQYWKLEAGTYYIKVDTSGYDGDWEGKDIQLTFDTFEDDGYEPNDRYQQATPVQLGEPMTIRFSGDNDVDWFKIKVDKRISLKLKVDGNYASFYEIYTEEELQKIDPQPLMNYRNNPLDQAYKYWKLEAGTYYIKLFPTNSKRYKELWEGKDIKITFDTALDDGYEPNDSYQQAASVQFDERMTIKLSGFNDVDWFKVNLDYKVALKLKADNTVSYKIYSEEELQKSNPTSLGAGRLESGYQYYELEAGTYYIRFEPYYTSTIGEQIRITFGLFENDQYEPNDTYQQATSIHLGEPMKIRFTGVTDIDWFKLKLEKPTAWNIKTDKSYSLAYSIYTEEEMKKSDPQPFINSGLDSSEDYMKFEAGIYYIKINQTTSSYYLGDKDIMLMSNFTLDDASEYNDTIESATALLLNEEKSININAPNDVDWFKFSLAEAQPLQLSMVSTISNAYQYEIYSVSNLEQCINSGTLDSKNGSTSLTLDAGDYYLKISGDSRNHSEEMVSLLLAKDGVDLTRVSVRDYTPRGGSNDVYRNIEMTFSKPLLASSVTKDQFDIKCFNDTIDFDVQYVEGETKVTLVPKEPLNYASEYKVTVSKNLKAQDNGLRMISDFSWTFNTIEKRPTDSQVGTLAGKVILPDQLKGLVIAAKVQIFEGETLRQTVTPTIDGKFSVPHLAVGTYNVRVKLEGFLSDSRTVTLNYGDDLTVELNPILGDLNGDGIIDLYDITTISSQYNQQSK